MSTLSFYSNGKLLITGEYLVLKGALALAAPTVHGQKTIINNIASDDNDPSRPDETISWKSYYKHDCWFEAAFSLPGMEIINTTNSKTADYVQRLLLEAIRLNPESFKGQGSFLVENKLDFSPEWGLGSSSSLISNVADWFEVDAYQLFSKMHKGSGYDIACAKAQGPLWYRKVLGSPVTQHVNFAPPFKDKLAFVYSGRKQDSELSVGSFLESIKVSVEDKERISTISRELPLTNTMEAFNDLLDEHESILSGILGMPAIKASRFSDFPGSIKSLGAWGGDFLLASGKIGFNEIKSYFSTKGMDVIFTWDDIIL